MWWIESIGWIGLTGLIICYIFYYFKKQKIFLIINILASGMLTLYAVLINNAQFFIVNSFITIINLINYINKKYKY